MAIKYHAPAYWPILGGIVIGGCGYLIAWMSHFNQLWTAFSTILFALFGGLIVGAIAEGHYCSIAEKENNEDPEDYDGR